MDDGTVRWMGRSPDADHRGDPSQRLYAGSGARFQKDRCVQGQQYSRRGPAGTLRQRRPENRGGKPQRGKKTRSRSSSPTILEEQTEEMELENNRGCLKWGTEPFHSAVNCMDGDDFMEVPIKKFFRLFPGNEVRFKEHISLPAMK